MSPLLGGRTTRLFVVLAGFGWRGVRFNSFLGVCLIGYAFVAAYVAIGLRPPRGG